MYSVREVTDNLYWVGANDHRIHLFENIFPLEHGVSYNAYLLVGEKETVLFDTVDHSASRQLIENIEHLLEGRKLDYMVINHMEPDHAATIGDILIRYPEVKVVSTEKAFMFMHQFGFDLTGHDTIEVDEGDTLTVDDHTLAFVKAPMIHWPEVMVTLDTTNGVLFSADAFGSFIALDGRLYSDEVNFERDWLDEARRYYTNIVGKYGPFVMNLLEKATPLLPQVKYVCSLHGPVWKADDLGWLIDKYVHWATYEPEVKGVMVVYASMYGNTEAAAQALAARICDLGVTDVVCYDVSNTDVSYLISETFKYSHIVLASVTYNLNIYPVMHNYLQDMAFLNVQNRTFAIMENGSWAIQSGDKMEKFIDEELKNCTVLSERVTMSSSLGEDKAIELENLAKAIVDSVNGVEE